MAIYYGLLNTNASCEPDVHINFTCLNTVAAIDTSVCSCVVTWLLSHMRVTCTAHIDKHILALKSHVCFSYIFVCLCVRGVRSVRVRREKCVIREAVL